MAGVMATLRALALLAGDLSTAADTASRAIEERPDLRTAHTLLAQITQRQAARIACDSSSAIAPSSLGKAEKSSLSRICHSVIVTLSLGLD